MKNLSLKLSCATALSLFIGGMASAATSTTTFQVTASVAAACTISATNLDFGAYVPASVTDNDNISTLTAYCTLLTPYNVGLNAGSATGATVATRKMSKGLDTISYSLFRESGRTTNWGNTVLIDTVAGVGTGTDQAITVYGRIPASQNVPTGSYADTITATINF